MCGIAAIFAYGKAAPSVNREELIRIREAMYARGPDSAGVWLPNDGRVGLAQRRLSIIDLSDAGAQPMATKDGRLRVVFNGEIYNYRALRADLTKKGYHFYSNSDTEVLLHLYTEKGLNMVQDLRGMYAFALYDEMKKGILLVRDPFGIKPLYYTDDGHTLRVASQVKALLKGDHIDTTLEPAGHVGFFLWGYVPEPYTLYKGIRALPAGSTLWVDETSRHELNNFYNISSELAIADGIASEISYEEVREHLRTALADSVRHHLIADVPIGIFLSSGLDSTTLTALALEAGSDSLHTITLGFKEYRGTENDETPLAELVARYYGTLHQTEWISKDEFQADLGHLLGVMDQPTIDGVNTYFVSKVTARTGLKVALSGLGADELFGGYPSFRQIPRMVDTFSLLPSTPHLGKAFRWISSPILKRFTSPKYAGLLEYGSGYGGAYLLRRGLFMPWELPDILDGEIVRKGWEELQPLIRLGETIREIETNHLRVSALEMTWYMRNQLLRDADWAGMAHSLEIRVPLVDVELLRSLAPLLAMCQPLTKLDMVDTPFKPLPEEILSRRKTGFTVPVREWLLQEGTISSAERGLRGWARRIYSLNGHNV